MSTYAIYFNDGVFTLQTTKKEQGHHQYANGNQREIECGLTTVMLKHIACNERTRSTTQCRKYYN